MKMRKCAILSMDSLANFESYDHLVIPYLNKFGWQVDTISWRQPDVVWSNYEAVIIRTPWDYQSDEQQFLAVLTDIEQSSAHLENPIEIVRWNIDKIYMQELALHGVDIVPTDWHPKLEQQPLTVDTLDIYFKAFDTEQIIIKPRVSANADNTFWLKQSTAEQHVEQLNHVFAQRDFMVQPFISNILSEGEFSLFYFNGHYSHAILKTPKKNDFRVQEEFGSLLTAVEPEVVLKHAADKCIGAINSIHTTPLYARVDFVRHENGFALMEAELIEPSLYFNMDAGSAERFAEAFVERMHQLTI
ncbi:ATP-grasp domain-containing protein [Thalassotalea sediminis]|uniref:ATP-grasp domain-containing protein n=1 Tax=Thalassotalea sediminis TaxID=1759089 RepID=UPI00257335D6|nr:hypothetical protein [Thalassotalea sediminis]